MIDVETGKALPDDDRPHGGRLHEPAVARRRQRLLLLAPPPARRRRARDRGLQAHHAVPPSPRHAGRRRSGSSFAQGPVAERDDERRRLPEHRAAPRARRTRSARSSTATRTSSRCTRRRSATTGDLSKHGHGVVAVDDDLRRRRLGDRLRGARRRDRPDDLAAARRASRWCARRSPSPDFAQATVVVPPGRCRRRRARRRPRTRSTSSSPRAAPGRSDASATPRARSVEPILALPDDFPAGVVVSASPDVDGVLIADRVVDARRAARTPTTRRPARSPTRSSIRPASYDDVPGYESVEVEVHEPRRREGAALDHLQERASSSTARTRRCSPATARTASARTSTSTRRASRGSSAAA